MMLDPVEVSDDSHLSERSPIYNRLAPAYHALWPAVAAKRIGSVIRGLPLCAGHEILEVGVGTGISLRHYPTDVRVTGVDLSTSMLAEATADIEREDWTHVRLLPMNAEELTFDDDSFDVVTSFHTISVVSDPSRMMREVVRVCRPGGRIVIINHFRSENPLVARVVDASGGLTRRLGWRTDLDAESILHDMPLRIDRVYKSSPASLFRIIEAIKVG